MTVQLLTPALIARGARGAVVAPHHLAAQAGVAILRAGGHAVDAAIATNAALAVVAGNLCGLGGDAFWLIWSAGDRRQSALNGSGRAPALASPDAIRGRAGSGTAMPLRGPDTITVPGAVRSWTDAHERFGALPFGALLGPAIELAERGFPASPGWVRSVEASAGAFEALGSSASGWFETYRPHGRPPAIGEVVRLPALARTLRRLADAGPEDFYDGEIAARQATALEAAGSAIRLGDLRAHTSTWGVPIAATYRGTTVTSHPPNSSGFVALELLNILECFPPPPPEAFGAAGADSRWVHLTIEAARLALADRDDWLTDPEAYAVPLERLLDKDYAGELAARIDEARAAPARASGPRGGGTAYMAAVDADGNAVSLIESNYMGFGSGIVDPETGIGYQNRGAYFSLDPDHPNVLAPRKRTLHTLLPGMLFRDGEPWVVAGSMGGDAQPAIHAQLVSAMVDGRLDVATAVGAPRVSAEAAAHYGPRDVVVAEPRFRPGLLEQLEAMGHHVAPANPFDAALGHCHAIELVAGGPPRDGSLAAATDPRSDGLPAVL